uniref:Uncharacterized protein n=1 Tax=Hippocampus comes TaxID=109280 RepID=A0A3Q2XUW6_HIPCM
MSSMLCHLSPLRRWGKNIITLHRVLFLKLLQCIGEESCSYLFKHSFISTSCSPVFICSGHSACIGGTRNCWDWCSNRSQVLDDRGEELLAGALIEVKADLVGHQQVVLLHQLFQDITDSLGIIQEY